MPGNKDLASIMSVINKELWKKGSYYYSPKTGLKLSHMILDISWQRSLSLLCIYKCDSTYLLEQEYDAEVLGVPVKLDVGRSPDEILLRFAENE